MHGNKYQGGFPDLYCMHKMYGDRWIEIKQPDKVVFTEYQLYYFPKIRRVWVLTGTSREEYKKLFKMPNYHCQLVRYNNSIEARRKETVVQSHYEGQIQRKVEADLEALGYTVMPTYGNNIQRGIPDLLVLKNGKAQWVELKRIASFTDAQKRTFHEMLSCGVDIWILDVSQEKYDLSILRRPSNLNSYLQ